MAFVVLSGVGALMEERGLTKGILNNPDMRPQMEMKTRFADVKGVDEAKVGFPRPCHLWILYTFSILRKHPSVIKASYVGACPDAQEESMAGRPSLYSAGVRCLYQSSTKHIPDITQSRAH